MVRHAAHRDSAKLTALIKLKRAKRDAAEPHRLVEDRIEHRREVTGRRIDYAQHLCGSGLLFEGLVRFGDEARVLHRYDRLRGEVVDKADLLVREGTCFLSVHAEQ